MLNNFSWKEIVKLPVVSNKKRSCDLDEFEDLLTESIKVCAAESLKQNKNVIVTTLSGGLDSSLCLAIIRKLYGDKVEIHTFTTSGSEEHPDFQFAKMISEKFGTIHHELIPTEIEVKKAKEILSLHEENESFSDGDLAVFLTYQNIAKNGFRFVITHDGIDELLGGYWPHRKHEKEENKIKVFEELWNTLEEKHLLPLKNKASLFNIKVISPYLNKEFVKYSSQIPVHERTSREISKIPLRTIAEKYLPIEVIERKKWGFCDALKVK